MAVYEVTLSDGSTIDVEASSPEEAAQIAARQIDEKYAAQPSKPLHGSELAAQREDDALKDRLAAYAPAGDPLAKPGAMARKPDLFDAAMAGEIPSEPKKSLQQDIADRLRVFADTILAPLDSRDVPANDPVNALTRMAVEPIARLPEAMVRDPLKTIAQDYNPIYQAGMGVKGLESAAGKAVQGDFAGAGQDALQGTTEVLGGALGLMGIKGGPKLPGNATSLAQAERMAANTHVPPPVATPPKAPEVAPEAMTYEDVAELVRTAARGGMGSQQAVEKLARAAPLNKDAAAAAERLGIDVPPDVLLDHTQLKEAIGLTRSMPGTLASAAWADAVERAATKADEAMAMIDGSPDLSEVSDTVMKSMQDTQRALQAQSDDMYKLINGRISGGAKEAAPSTVSQAPQSRSVASVTTKDGRKYDVTAEVFKDRDAVVMSPMYPSNITDDLEGAIRHQRSTQSARKAGMDIVNDAPRAPDWAEQNPAEWGDVQRQVGERFLGMVNSTPGPHILALVDGVDINSLATLIEDGLPKGKMIMRSPGNGELAVVNRGQVPKQFARWETYSNLRFNQKQGILPHPAEWASAKHASPSSPPSNVTQINSTPKPPIVKNGEPAVPPPTVDLVNSRKLMDGVVRELGGDTSKLSSLEKELVNMASPGRKTPVTYAALMRMKSDVGQALEKASGPYKDVNSGILKRLYGALAEDQLANVERIGGKQLRDDLRLANQLTAKRKALEDRIVSLFGDERNGSIAQKLVATVRSGAKGDISGFNRIVHQLPADLRKKAVATAIAAASRETKTNGFGFAKYVDLYQGLRRNSEVYKTVVQTLGPESEQFLNDLYKISKRITEARANVKTTGQANQALVQGMMAEGLVQKVMQSTAGRQATMGTATVLGGTMAGPAAGAASAMLVNTLAKGSKNTINAAGDLFASPEWQQLVAQVAAEDRVNPKAFNIAKSSKAFLRWAKSAGITDPDAWLRNALASSIGTGIAVKAGQSQPIQKPQGENQALQVIPKAEVDQMRNTWDKRVDGSEKGDGWLGVLKRPDGGVSSEISVGLDIDGKEVEFPVLVPTLSQDQVNTILRMNPEDPQFWNKLPADIRQKAVNHALARMRQGKSPFAGAGETPYSGQQAAQ